MCDFPVDAANNPRTFLIVGLGNPGRQYRLTRHNVGFMVVDRFCNETNISMQRLQSEAIIGSGVIDMDKIIVAKPQTFMNLSGKSVGALARFYKIPLEQLLVIHDDVDLPFGTIRIRGSGGSGGQKGLKSVIEHLGTEQFARLRIGIGRPPGRMDPVEYVLHEFDPAEQESLYQILSRASQAVESFVRYGLTKTMNQYNGSILNE